MTAPVWPVSVKGVLIWHDQVLVVRNERDEWELPGGRLELDESSPEDAVRREFAEEVDIDVEVGELVDSWIYDVAGRRVLINVYRCHAEQPVELWHSDEHSGVALLPVSSLGAEALPAGYRRSIELARQKSR